jgi:hypothetical protein
MGICGKLFGTPTCFQSNQFAERPAGRLFTAGATLCSRERPGKSQQDDLPPAGTVCGAQGERYSPGGIATRAEHFPGEEGPGSAAMTKEQFTAIVERVAAVFPDGCTVHTDPPG